ncbi:DUF1206 domain-containing protein [Microbacterium sp. AZCO]|uniref:DUF1206 domain-containing protein n=1 Tax=Microbacterium sp. AZCO TaxID=3142976 RepID=UPI0031F39AC3
MKGEAKAEAKHVARETESNGGVRVLARAGYFANGVVHALVGIIVLVLAFGGRGESDQAGAFKAIAAAPVGFAALWVLAVTLWALGVYHAAEGLLARRDGEKHAPGDDGPRRGDDRPRRGDDQPRRGSDPERRGSDQPERATRRKIATKWGRRVAEWGQALVFLALGGIAASVALGARPNGEAAAEGASRGILSIPGGPLLLGVFGVAVGGAGLAFVVMGVRRSFRDKLELPDGALGITVAVLGVFGFVAKGVALVIVGAIFLIAAVRIDPKAAGGLDGAVDAMKSLPAGSWLAAAVGVGFIAYGVFCGFRGRYAKL